MTSSANVVTEDGGRQNMYGVESRPYIDENYKGYAKEVVDFNKVLKKLISSDERI